MRKQTVRVGQEVACQGCRVGRIRNRVPVVREREEDVDAMVLSELDELVELGEAVRTGINLGLTVANQLEPAATVVGNFRDI